MSDEQPTVIPHAKRVGICWICSETSPGAG